MTKRTDSMTQLDLTGDDGCKVTVTNKLGITANTTGRRLQRSEKTSEEPARRHMTQPLATPHDARAPTGRCSGDRTGVAGRRDRVDRRRGDGTTAITA